MPRPLKTLMNFNNREILFYVCSQITVCISYIIWKSSFRFLWLCIYNVGLVHTFPFQCLKICSSAENFHIEVEQLRSIFKHNNYPAIIIDQPIKTFLDKLYAPKHLVPTVTWKGIANCSSIFRKIFCEYKTMFVLIIQQNITTMQHKNYLSV